MIVWNGVEGELVVDLSDLPDYQLVITFRSFGHDDPGSRYGGPDNLGWPPDGEDERTLVEAHILSSSGTIIRLPMAEQQRVFEIFRDEVDDVNLDLPPRTWR